MNTKKVIGMLLLALFCAVCFPGHAQQVVPLTFNVFVAVQCPDETTKILIESYIKRELLGLRDVIVDLQSESLSDILSSDEAPRIDTLVTILNVLGGRFSIEPIAGTDYHNPVVEKGVEQVTEPHLS